MRSNHGMDCQALGRAGRWRVVWNIRAAFLGLWIVCATACGQGVADSGIRHSRVILDVRSLLAAPLSGDFVTVADTARLTISSGGTQSTQTRVLGPGEFEMDFDVSVKSGPATFGVDVISTNGTRLYTGETSTTVDADGFAVTVTPHAVDAGMVVSPRAMTFSMSVDTIFVGNGFVIVRRFTAALRVRNPGSSVLTWRVDSLVTLPPGVTIFCDAPSEDDTCLHTLQWAPAKEAIVFVGFSMPTTATAPPAQSILFVSNVGSTVPARLP